MISKNNPLITQNVHSYDKRIDSGQNCPQTQTQYANTMFSLTPLVGKNALGVIQRNAQTKQLPGKVISFSAKNAATQIELQAGVLTF